MFVFSVLKLIREEYSRLIRGSDEIPADPYDSLHVWPLRPCYSIDAALYTQRTGVSLALCVNVIAEVLGR